MKRKYMLCFLGLYFTISCNNLPSGQGISKVDKSIGHETEMSTILGIDHIGINVPNIDSATVFLQKAFDAKVIYESLSKNDPPVDLTGIEETLNVAPGTKIYAGRMIKIGYGPTIELFEDHAQDQRSAVRSSDLGLQHIALYTNDMRKSIERFVFAGGKILSKPRQILFPEEKGKRNFFCYGMAPWGTSIEFISYPDKMPYEGHTTLRRWKVGAYLKE